MQNTGRRDYKVFRELNNRREGRAGDRHGGGGEGSGRLLMTTTTTNHDCLVFEDGMDM